VTTAGERAEAALASANATLAQPRRETSLEWANRAPTDPEAIPAWLREAPDEPEPATARAPPPPAPQASIGEVAALKAQVAALETRIADMNRPKERRRRKAGRSYLVADYGGKDE